MWRCNFESDWLGTTTWVVALPHSSLVRLAVEALRRQHTAHNSTASWVPHQKSNKIIIIIIIIIILFFKIYLKNIYWKCVNVWFAHTMSTWHGTLIALHVDFFCLFCTPKYPFVQFFLSPLLFLILFIFLAKQPLLTSFHVICIPLLTRFCHIPFVHWPLCRNSAQK